jgi:hypothetical protein
MPAPIRNPPQSLVRIPNLFQDTCKLPQKVTHSHQRLRMLFLLLVRINPLQVL